MYVFVKNLTQVLLMVNFRVLPSSPFDLIIGRSTIKLFKLGLLLPSHFFDEETSVTIRGATHPFSPVHIMVDRLISGERDNNSQASQLVAANAASVRVRVMPGVALHSSRQFIRGE